MGGALNSPQETCSGITGLDLLHELVDKHEKKKEDLDEDVDEDD